MKGIYEERREGEGEVHVGCREQGQTTGVLGE